MNLMLNLLRKKGKTKLELSLKIWSEVAGSGDFAKDCNLLLFNKKDVFEEAIAKKKKFKAFKKRFPDYEGDHSSEQVQNFIRDKFLEAARDKGLSTENIFTDFTCAIDTEKMNFAWKSVNEWVLHSRIKEGGFEL